MPSTLAIVLAETGQTINVLVPILGGILLLAGIGAFVFAQVRRRRFADPVGPAAPPAASTPEIETPPTRDPE